jgi:hypothetical protein
MSTPTPRFIREGKQDSPVCPKNYIHKDVKHDSNCTNDHNHILFNGFCYSPYPVSCDTLGQPGVDQDENGHCYTKRSLEDVEQYYVTRLQGYNEGRKKLFKEFDTYAPYSFQNRNQLLKEEEKLPYVQYYNDIEDEERLMETQYKDCVQFTCPTLQTDNCKKACRQFVPQMDCEEQFNEYQNAPEVQPGKKEIRSRAMQCKHIGMANCVHENLYIPYYGPDMIDISTRMKSIYKSRFGEDFPGTACNSEIGKYKKAVQEYENNLAKNSIFPDQDGRLNLEKYNLRDLAINTKDQDVANANLTACMRQVYEKKEAADKRPDALRRVVCRRSTYKTLKK